MSALLNPMYVDYDGAGRRVAHPSILDRTIDAVSALAVNPLVIAELCINDEEAAAIGAALGKDDAVALMRAYRAAMDRHVQELIDTENHKRWERGLPESDYESAIALQRIYQ